MSVEAVLERRKDELGGRSITNDEARDLQRDISPSLLPQWLLNLMATYPVIGARFRLSENQDQSGLGVDMKWLTPGQMVSEAKEAQPGIAAAVSSYLPIGMCLQGSGDPYFLQAGSGEDPPVVRIPHQALDGEYRLQEDQVEIVSENLSKFLSETELG